MLAAARLTLMRSPLVITLHCDLRKLVVWCLNLYPNATLGVSIDEKPQVPDGDQALALQPLIGYS
jgi:hypothetical protein